jgi:hypothetical protein
VVNFSLAPKGERSRVFAEALRNWIPKIINAVRPWLSSEDIDKGARWSVDVAAQLEASKVGIICLTPGNVHSDWILFEAGALSKTIQKTFVCPLLLDLNPSDVKGPLAQFQSTRVEKSEMKKLLRTINSALGDRALSDAHLDEAFEVWWPRLDKQLKDLPSEEGVVRKQRPEREILEELLVLVRNDSRKDEIPSRELSVSKISAALALLSEQGIYKAVTLQAIGINGTSVVLNFGTAVGPVEIAVTRVMFNNVSVAQLSEYLSQNFHEEYRRRSPETLR